MEEHRDPKKRFITGLQEHSLLGLRSHVAKKQSETTGIPYKSRQTRTTSLLHFGTHERRGQHRGRLASLLQRKNKGVDARMTRDVADDSGRTQVSDEERTAILEQKARMYESQATGTVFQSLHSRHGVEIEPSRPTLGTSRRDARVNMIMRLEKETQEARDQARARKEHAVQDRARVREFWRRQYITQRRQEKTQPQTDLV